MTLKLIRGRIGTDQVQISNTRWDDDCQCVQSTSDGGATWVDSPQYDPRTSGTYLLPTGASSAQCDGAARMIHALQDQLDLLYASTNALSFATSIMALVMSTNSCGKLAREAVIF